MSYYRTCPRCGANLDPGEVCDCSESTQDLRAEIAQLILGMTDEECGVILAVMELHDQHPEFTPEECVQIMKGVTRW